MHISLHEISDNVDVIIACWSWWLLHIHKPNDVFVIKEFQQFDLSNNSLGIN